MSSGYSDCRNAEYIVISLSVIMLNVLLSAVIPSAGMPNVLTLSVVRVIVVALLRNKKVLSFHLSDVFAI